MNIENIDKAIAVMTRALPGTINMLNWQFDKDGRQLSCAPRDEEDFHACGNTACFAGRIGISPEWINSTTPTQRFGIEGNGIPSIKPMAANVTDADDDDGELDPVDSTIFGAMAIARWLGILNVTADLLCHRPENEDASIGLTVHPVYGRPWADIEAADIINVLVSLKTNGEIAVLQNALVNAIEAEKQGAVFFTSLHNRIESAILMLDNSRLG